jgi:hypothetical protein
LDPPKNQQFLSVFTGKSPVARIFSGQLILLPSKFLPNQKNRQVPLFPVKSVWHCFTGQEPPAEITNALFKGHNINISKIVIYV